MTTWTTKNLKFQPPASIRNAMAALCCVLICGLTNAHAAIVIDVIPSPAPNSFGSPSWGTYMSNGMTAIQNGLSSIGDRETDPTAYLAFADGSLVNAGNAMVTSFKSWVGVAEPAAPFANELGNRIHFGLHAYGDTQFTLADVNYQLTSNDGNLLGTSGTLASTTFNGTSRIGIDWGMDGIGGTPDDIVYNNNEGNSTLVNELIYIGVGNGYWPGGDDPTPANPAIGKQESIDGTYEWVSANSPLVFSGTYSILGYSGGAGVTLVPEPGSIALMGLAGMFGTAVYLRRRWA